MMPLTVAYHGLNTISRIQQSVLGRPYADL